MKCLYFIFFLFYSTSLFALEVYHIKPSYITAGSKITIYGDGFNNQLEILLGSNIITPHKISTNSIDLFLPKGLDPAIYLLTIKNKWNEQIVIPITLKEPIPVIQEFMPKSIDICEKNPLFSIHGLNLEEIKKISINGIDINTVNINNDSISFYIPQDILQNNVKALIVYLYDTKKRPLNILNIEVNTTPQIENINVKNSYFNYYEMSIMGKNFVKGSKLFINDVMVNERTPDTNQSGFFQQSYIYKNIPVSLLHDYFYMESCEQINYVRYPFSTEDKDLKIYVESPTGIRSNTYIFQGP